MSAPWGELAVFVAVLVLVSLARGCMGGLA